MGKTILVTGKEGFLGNEISQHFLNQGHKVAVSVPPRKETAPAISQDRRFLQFPWTRRSAVAAKNFVLQTVQEFGGLDEAWIIVTPERETFSLAELAPLALDEGLDTTVKGTLYLIRELLQHQAVHPSLVFRFVFYDEDPSNQPPLAALHYHGLKALVSSLIAQAHKRQLSLWAYETLVTRTEEYLAFVLGAKTNLPGRWNVLGEKKTLMNSLFTKKDSP
jgi:NAD(P)-dependent dehydrogenase (short-subunit alcohol dehydrogenase family)